MSFEPKIIGFLCNWCSYTGADLAGVSRIKSAPNVRIIRTMCSGRVDPSFILRAFQLGADGVVVATAELVALGCIRCSRCESGRGCPRGIATTDAELAGTIDIEWGTQRIINLYSAWRQEFVAILRRFGMRRVSELRGRSDLLMHLDYTNDTEHGHE